MAISIPKYQALYFKSLQDRTINTGPNLITNGNFNADLSGWIADDYVFSSGTAGYQWTYGCYRGSIQQNNINILENNRYKIRFKYRATKSFDIVVRFFHMTTPDFDAMEEKVFAAITDGNWHVVEYYVNSNINSTQYLLLGNRATGIGDFSACHDTGNSENGLFFDEVSIYAQKSVIDCGSCDTVYIDNSKPIEFQIKGTRPTGNNLYPNTNYNINPFSEITSVDLNFTAYPALTYSNINQYFTLYIADKVYFFGFYDGAGGDPDYQVTTNGNINHIKIRFTTGSSTYVERLENALTGVIDVNHGTTTTRTGYNLFIAGMPAGSYLHDPYNMLMSINTVTPPISSLQLIDGYYNSTTKQLNYFFVQNNVVIAPPVSSNNVMSIKENVSLSSGLLYRIRYGYATVHSFNHIFNIRNSSNVVVFTQSSNPITPSFSGGVLTYEFTCPATDTYTLEFIFTPNEPNAQLAFDNVTVIELRQFNINLQSKDCQGNIATLPFTQIPADTGALIQINNTDFPANGSFHVIINDIDTDSVGLQHFSQNLLPIDLHSSKECELLNRLIKIKWSNDCRFGDINYPGLPFENEILVYGYLKKAPIDKKERIQFTQSGGLPKTIYNHSVGKVEVQLAPYSDALMTNLERAFEHKNLQLNDEVYLNDDSSTLVINSLDNGKYTARIELVKSGTELITTNCCC